MGTVTRLMPRSPEGIRFMLEHEYEKLVGLGLVPRTKSWPKKLRELRYLQAAILAAKMLEDMGDNPDTFNAFAQRILRGFDDTDEPDDAA